MAERITIFCHINYLEESRKLMNKRPELTGVCGCNARFLNAYLKGKGGADEASIGCQKWLVRKVMEVNISNLWANL